MTLTWAKPEAVNPDRLLSSRHSRRSLAFLVLLNLAGMAAAEPLVPDRIAELGGERRDEWEAYWERSEKLRAKDEMLIQQELEGLGEGARWRPAPTGRMLPGRGWRGDGGWYRSEEAREVARNLASFQTPAGGWSKNVAIGRAPRETGMGFSESRAHYRGTFDNHATTGPLRVLGRIAAEQDDEVARASFLRGLNYIFDAQYPNGGWPQGYPLEGGYHDNVTFNDGAMLHVLEFLHEVADGRYPFVDEAARRRAREALAGGQAFILASQVEQDGRRTVWCAQHDPLTLAPAKARSYEWASLSGGESAGIVLYLMERDAGDPEVRQAIEAAHAWFEAKAIRGKEFRRRSLELVDKPGAGPLWARFYELGSGRPMFVERNAERAVYSVEELPAESNGYAWYTDAGREVLERYPEWKKEAEGAAAQAGGD